MRAMTILLGLAAVLAALTLAAGNAVLAEQAQRANAALARAAPTLPAPGFFAGAGVSSPL